MTAVYYGTITKTELCMSDQQPPKATIVEHKGISAVWLIPMIALIFGVWLVIKSVSERGTYITVQFENASGIVAGKTQVRYKGLPAGVVTSVNISDDLQSVIAEIEMASSTSNLLTENTLFWYVTADISLQGISGLDTLLSGSYINIQPDFDGNGISQQQFIALSEPPPLDKSTPGLHLILQADSLGSVTKNAPVSYKKMTVGYVSGYQYSSENQRVNINVFIKPEFAHLVNQHSKFWNASGIEVSGSLTSDIQIKTESVASLISGGIAFDDAKFEEAKPPAKNGDKYPLYADFQTAEMGDQIELLLNWDSGIDRGASILYHGLKLGVIDAFTNIDPQKQFITATAKINPRATPYLTSNTQFFVVKPTIDLGGVNNINALLKGSYVSLRPTLDGDPKKSFTVYNNKPAYRYDEPGRHLMLTATDVSSLRVGSGVYYRKQKVGTVQAIDNTVATEQLVHIHIQDKYKHFVKQDSHFWNISGITMSGNLQGVNIQAHSLQTVLSGGIAFDSPKHDNNDNVNNGDNYQLYPDKEIAQERVLIQLTAASSKGLSSNTKIRFQGEKVGSVHKIERHNSGIKMVVGLKPDYQFLTKEHSQFWLAQPTLSLAGLRDSEAIFGGTYIGVNAGEGRATSSFTLASTPPKKRASAPGLQLSLNTSTGQAIDTGSPVSYKGIVVGQVDNVAIDSNNHDITLNITINDDYRHLVTYQTRFYNASGVTVSGGLSNFVVKAASADAIIRGGISFYTPQNNGAATNAQDDEHFTLFNNIADAQMAGISISIHFNSTEGLKDKLPIKYQDQQVGEVSKIIFDPKSYGATVFALLNDNGKKFAVNGSKFWHQTSELGLVGNNNVTSILDGGFIGVLPGKGKVQTQFTAEDIAPAVTSLPYGLNITLIANQLGSVRVGNPVLYRQMKVGRVIGVELSSLANNVNIYINIAKRYAPLVNADSKFWNNSGFTIDAGLLSGINIDSESLETLMAGGISFATPNKTTKQSQKLIQRQQFELHSTKNDEWVSWAPKISID